MPGSAASRRRRTSRHPRPAARARGLPAPRRINNPTAADSARARLGPLLPPNSGPPYPPPPGASNGKGGREAGRRDKGAWGSSVGQAPEPRRAVPHQVVPYRAVPCQAVPRSPVTPPTVPRARRAPPPRRRGSFVPQATWKRGMGGRERG